MSNNGSNIKDFLTEIRIGVFAFGALLILFLAFISMKDISVMRGSYLVRVDFKFAEGIKPASPVRFAGVDVGEVKKVQIEKTSGGYAVMVYAKIKEGVEIPRNSEVFINSLSLFGEKYLEIIPPSSVEGFIQPEDVLNGNDPIPLYTIFSSFYSTMQRIDRMVGDEGVKDSLKEIVINLESASGSLSGIMGVINSGEGNIGKFIYDDKLYNIAAEALLDIKENPWKLLYRPRNK